MRATIILFISFLFFQTSFAVVTTWSGATNAWWNTAGNWDNGVPTSSDDIVIPDVSGASGNFPAFSGSSNISCRDLTIDSGASLTLNGSSSAALNVYGDIVVNGTITGTFNMLRLYGGTGAISGTPTDVSGVELYSRGGSVYTLNSNWSIYELETQDVGSTFNVASGVTLTISNRIYNRNDCRVILLGSANLDLNGGPNIIPEARSTFTMNSGTLYINSTFLGGNTSATFNAGTGTVVLDGNSSTSVNITYTFNNLTIAKDATDDIVTCQDASDDITVNGNLVITEGTLQPTLADLTVNGTTTITDGELIGGAAPITLTGNITMDNDAYMTINTSTSPIWFDGNLTMNGTSGLRNTGGATATFTIKGTSNTISCNTGANSSTAYIYTSWSDFDIDITSDWTIADLQIQSNSGSDPDISVSTGKTLTITGDFHNESRGSNTTFTLEDTANLDVGGNFTNETTVIVNSGTISIEGNFINSGTFTDGTGTVTFDGSANSVIDDPDGIEFYNLTINKDATADVVSCNDADADITVANNLTITEGTLSPTLADCSVTGTTTLTDGKYIGIDAATTFTGDITMNNDAIIDHQATVENGDINIAGSITMNGTSGIQSSTATGRWIDLNGATKTISVTTAANSSTSNFNLNSGASYTLNNSLTINKFYMSSGVNSFAVADGQTLTLNSTIYTQANSSFTLTGAANMNVAGDAWLAHLSGCTFTLNTGTLDVDGDLRCTGSGVGTFNANSGTVRVAGNIPNSGGNTGTFDWRTSTLEMNGTSGTLTMTAGGASLYNFTLNDGGGTATYEIQEAIDVNGNLTITGGTLDTKSANSYAISCAGNWTNDDSFTSNSSTVTFDGSSAQSIGGSSTTTFNNLTLNNASGLALGVNSFVEGTLTFTSGKFTVQGYTLTLGSTSANATVTGESSSNYFVAYNNGGTIGNLKQRVNANATYDFPIGDLTNYTPVTFTLNSNGGLASAEVNVYTDDGVNADFNTSTINTYITREWDVTQTGITTPNYDISYVYPDGDITGTEAELLPVKYSSNVWYSPTGSSFRDDTKEGTGSVTAGTNTLTWTGLSTFSKFSGAGDTDAVLPVDLLSLIAECNRDDVEITWVTASEINNDYFLLEKSDQSGVFDYLGEIAGNGTTTEMNEYSFTDYDYQNGTAYYRLTQYDFNGEKEVFDIVSVSCEQDQSDSKISTISNKDVGYINLQAEDLGENVFYGLRVFDAAGKQVYNREHYTESGRTDDKVSIYNQSSGIYIIQLNVEGKVLIDKVVW